MIKVITAVKNPLIFNWHFMGWQIDYKHMGAPFRKKKERNTNTFSVCSEGKRVNQYSWTWAVIVKDEEEEGNLCTDDYSRAYFLVCFRTFGRNQPCANTQSSNRVMNVCSVRLLVVLFYCVDRQFYGLQKHMRILIAHLLVSESNLFAANELIKIGAFVACVHRKLLRSRHITNALNAFCSIFPANFFSLLPIRCMVGKTGIGRHFSFSTQMSNLFPFDKSFPFFCLSQLVFILHRINSNWCLFMTVALFLSKYQQ